jgi:hypothetical protein
VENEGVIFQEKLKDISLQVFSASLLDVTARIFNRALVDESGMIRIKMEKHNRSENGCSARNAFYDTIP